MTGYDFKPKPEFVWFLVIAVLTVVMQMLVEFDPEAIIDWQAWAIGIGAAMIRALAGAFLAYVAKEGLTYEDDRSEQSP